MKDKLKTILKRSPKIYNLVKKGYSTFHNSCYKLKFHLFGTKFEEKYWINKKDDIRDCWKSINHPHRNFLMEKICKFSPSNILEVGSSCGPNLRLLAKKFPNAKIVGIDVNPVAVKRGNELFAQQDVSNVKLLFGKAYELEQFRDESFDVVFTDAVLIYIGPDKIRKAIEEMLRVTNQALILLEWHSKSNPLGVYVGHWMRDYATLLKEFIPENKIRITKLPGGLWGGNWQKYGAVIEAIK